MRAIGVVERAAQNGQQEPVTSKFQRSAKRFMGMVAQITHEGDAAIVSTPPGPPKRIDGYTVGVIPNLEGSAPHRGEVHTDGDEFLYLVNGAIEVVLDEQTIGAETTVVLREGDAFVVPRGVWHRIRVIEPAYFVHVTPSPNGGHRPSSPTICQQ
ncbi:MAG: cupin domain-containing protein [Actinomycetota bacterium]